MIEMVGLTKRYGRKVAVDHLTCAVRPGVVTGFLGPNGAGKSTTMRLILGLDRPTSGRVTVDGRPYERIGDPLRDMGVLLEARGAHGGRSAFHHLLCLAQSNGIPTSRVNEVLRTVGLTAVARKKVKGFSLGMSQRLGIAVALLGDPRILMFDEPVNGLDPEGIHWVRTLMKSLAAEGRTVFVSSHLMSEMALTAGHLVVIGQGRLLADLPMDEFIRRHARAYVRLRSPEGERLLDVLATAGVTVTRAPDGALEVADGDAAQLGELAAGHRVVLHELSPQQASLEEAFMRLTAQSVEYHARAEGTLGPGEDGPGGLAPQPDRPGGGTAEDPGGGQPEESGAAQPGKPGAGRQDRPSWGAEWKPRKWF